MKLSQLKTKKPATILSINSDDVEANRIISMGIKVGSIISVLRRGYGDIIHCRVKTTEFAIRNNLAEKIIVNIV